jgi:hypothetical protein
MTGILDYDGARAQKKCLKPVGASILQSDSSYKLKSQQAAKPLPLMLLQALQVLICPIGQVSRTGSSKMPKILPPCHQLN